MKAILFDLDGTLVDTLPLYIESYKKALIEQGFNLTDREIVEKCFGKTEEDICGNLGIPEHVDTFRSTYFEGVKNHFVEAKLFPDALKVLQVAKDKSLKLGIISFAYRWYVDGILSALDIAKYFDVIIGHEDVSKPKPDPEAIQLACKKLDVMGNEVLMIGDSKSDVVMGNIGGTKTALFHPEGHSLFYSLDALKQASPTFVIGSFRELIANYLI